MNLEDIIYRTPGGNTAFKLPDAITLGGLIEQCKLIRKTGYIDVTQADISSLKRQFSEYQIVVLTNVENLSNRHGLIYCLSSLLDFEEPYVLCVVSELKKFNNIQYDRSGALYLRWFWLEDFGRFLPHIKD